MARALVFGCFVAILGQISIEVLDIERLPPFLGSVAAGVIATLSLLASDGTGRPDHR